MPIVRVGDETWQHIKGLSNAQYGDTADSILQRLIDKIIDLDGLADLDAIEVSLCRVIHIIKRMNKGGR